MSTSVGMKARKKQSSKREAEADSLSASLNDPLIERTLLSLESICERVLDDDLATFAEDGERLYWQQRFKNIVTPVSLALAESKGPRHFHYHYRHSAADDSVLEPVLEPVMDMLARSCQHALEQCQKKLIGLREGDFVERQRLLESALRTFLSRYRVLKSK